MKELISNLRVCSRLGRKISLRSTEFLNFFVFLDALCYSFTCSVIWQMKSILITVHANKSSFPMWRHVYKVIGRSAKKTAGNDFIGQLSWFFVEFIRNKISKSLNTRVKSFNRHNKMYKIAIFPFLHNLISSIHCCCSPLLVYETWYIFINSGSFQPHLSKKNLINI